MLGSYEQKGNCLPLKAHYDEFQAWTDSCQLIHLNTRETTFTWSNGRRGRAFSERRLDRTICNNECLTFWNTSSCYTLLRSKLDNDQLLLILKRGIQSYPSSFKYFQMRSDQDDCQRLVKEVWKMEFFGCPIFILT